MTKKERYKYVIDWFKENMPVAETELHYSNVYELLVAVILSAQCTDKRVNKITPALLKKYPGIESMAAAKKEEVYNLIKSCSYPNSKTDYLIRSAQEIIDKYEGEIPDKRENLQSITGIGRKTANVILSVAFKKPVIAVDTHVFRVSARLGLSTNAKNTTQTEKQLVKYIPEELLAKSHHWLILHGRYICTAKNPKCNECGLKKYCKYYAKKYVSK